MKHFSHAELACPATGVVRLADGFEDHLATLREKYDRSMIVTSCCRSKSHNESIGGHRRSLHIWDHPHHGLNGTAAIDVRMPGNMEDRWRLFMLAHGLGWSIGIAKTFIHLDRRDLANLAQGLFGYG